jgi:hypothetical protein
VQYTKKVGKYDELRCVRDDNSVHSAAMPKIGSLPHDLVHFVIEKQLELNNGFYAHVEKGLINGYYLKTESAENPEKSAVDAQHAESLVECFQAEFVSGYQTPEYFQEILNVTCSARNIPAFIISAEQISNIRVLLDEMNNRWNKINIGETIELHF